MILGCFAGCVPEPPTVPVGTAAASIEVRSLPLRLAVVPRLQVVAQVNDAAGHPVGGAELVYRMPGNDLATVSPDGLVIAGASTGSTSRMANWCCASWLRPGQRWWNDARR